MSARRRRSAAGTPALPRASVTRIAPKPSTRANEATGTIETPVVADPALEAHRRAVAQEHSVIVEDDWLARLELPID